MYRSRFGRRARRVRPEEYEYGPRRRWRPRSRAGGCLLWVVLLILVLIALLVMFGGFQKGTKAGSLPHSVPVVTAAPIAVGVKAAGWADQ